jgi:hypothetical protein
MSQKLGFLPQLTQPRAGKIALSRRGRVYKRAVRQQLRRKGDAERRIFLSSVCGAAAEAGGEGQRKF